VEAVFQLWHSARQRDQEASGCGKTHPSDSALFCAGAFFVIAGGWFLKPLFTGLALIGSIYLIYILTASLVTCIQNKKAEYFFILPPVFMTMQLAWGLGFLAGIFKTYK